ncbi:unnamed protein product [Chrysoparadoxa australica]
MALSRAVGPTGLVYTYEPLTPVIGALRTNKLMNRLDNVRPIQAAVGAPEAEGETIEVPTTLADYGTYSLVLSHAANHESIAKAEKQEVPMLSLDSEFPPGSKCPSLVKADVEYMELSVVKGGAKMLTRCRPTLVLEYNMHTEEVLQWDEGALPLYLTELGYDVYWALSSMCRPDQIGTYFKATAEELATTTCIGHLSQNLLAIHTGGSQESISTPAFQIPPWPLTRWHADRRDTWSVCGGEKLLLPAPGPSHQKQVISKCY